MKRREFLLGASAAAIAVAALPRKQEPEWHVAHRTSSPEVVFYRNGSTVFISDIHGFSEGTQVRLPNGTWYDPKKRAAELGLRWDSLDSFHDFSLPTRQLTTINWKSPGKFDLS